MTPIRPLDHDDLPAVAALYAELDGWDGDDVAGYVEFFRRTLLEQPFADPEIPALVYDDPRDGVVGVMGSHPRRFVHEDRPLRVACSGPLIVAPAHRPRGIGALLLRKYVAGPQDMTVNDRVIDTVHAMWGLLGGVTDTVASIGWVRVLAPAGFLAEAATRRTIGRGKLPTGGALSKVDAPAVRRLNPAPGAGSSEPLTEDALLDLVPRLRRRFPLRPAYDRAYLSWLFQTMEGVGFGDRLVRRLVRASDGRPAGSYVTYVYEHGQAHVMQVAAADEDAGMVLDHLIHDTAMDGAVVLRGRLEPFLLPHLRRRRCWLTRSEWAMVQSRDPELVSAMLSGRALLSRIDGEWWMRPRPTLA